MPGIFSKYPYGTRAKLITKTEITFEIFPFLILRYLLLCYFHCSGHVLRKTSFETKYKDEVS